MKDPRRERPPGVRAGPPAEASRAKEGGNRSLGPRDLDEEDTKPRGLIQQTTWENSVLRQLRRFKYANTNFDNVTGLYKEKVFIH